MRTSRMRPEPLYSERFALRDESKDVACQSPDQGCSTLSTEDHCEHGVEASERGGEAVLRDRVGLAAA